MCSQHGTGKKSSLRLISFEHTKETNMQQDVGLVLDSIVKKVEGNILKYGAAKKKTCRKKEKSFHGSLQSRSYNHGR